MAVKLNTPIQKSSHSRFSVLDPFFSAYFSLELLLKIIKRVAPIKRLIMIEASLLKALEHKFPFSLVMEGDLVKSLHSEKQMPATMADPYPKAFFVSSLVARIDIKESETLSLSPSLPLLGKGVQTASATAHATSTRVSSTFIRPFIEKP